MLTPRWRWCAGVVALALAALAGCGDDDDSAQGSTTTTTSASGATTTTTTEPEVTTTTLSADETVLAAYEAMWAGYRAALDPPNAEHPQLLATHTGDALQRTRAFIATMLANNLVGRGPYELHPTIVSTGDTEAVVADCMVDDGHLYDATTGRRADNDPVAINNIETTMVLEGGTWKRSETQEKEEPCTPA